MSVLPDPIDDGYCIGCGPHAQMGLQMRFDVVEDLSVESRVSVGPGFQGWRDVVHGGIVALLLDEAMAYAAGAHGVLGMTGALKMRFRKPVPVGAPLVVRGNVRWRRRDVLGLAASIHDAEGTLLASGEGSFVKRGDVPPGALFAQSRSRGRS
ncbi:MAG: PaaI family thioesterase [Candidatus Eremiobacteraeota bacterium]|nr:PaaI family thioesterase [Candidatus Eremiobacteraeota bacterium]